jgi:hypothetical protein
MQAGLSERGQQSWPDTRRVANKKTKKMSKGAGSNITTPQVSIQKKTATRTQGWIGCRLTEASGDAENVIELMR